MQEHLTPAASLPVDGMVGTLVGRAWVPGRVPGPSPVAIRHDAVYDLGRSAPTLSELLNADDPLALAHAPGERLGSLAEILANSAYDRRDPASAHFLAPCDLQAVKASGVTFATSLLERVIEEQARGDPGRAEAIRRTISDVIGDRSLQDAAGLAEAASDSRSVLIASAPGRSISRSGSARMPRSSPNARRWRRSALGSEIGLRAESSWNNPEPELVVAVNAQGQIVGATLGNDVNLRDVEGRSALLLGKAKDNNASAAIGPFVRLLDDSFGLEQLRAATISLRVRGEDGFELEGASSMSRISRDVTDLVGQTLGANHQYPDGLMLFLRHHVRADQGSRPAGQRLHPQAGRPAC